LVVILIVNSEEHLLKTLPDKGASSSSASFLMHIPQPHSSKIMAVIQPHGLQWVVNSIQLKLVYALEIFKTDDSNTTTWSMMGGKFTTIKTGFVTFSLPEFNLKKQMCSSWAFHVDDRSESSSTYDIIIGNQPRSSWRIRHNHEL
jgi:hypothetical protein